MKAEFIESPHQFINRLIYVIKSLGATIEQQCGNTGAPVAKLPWLPRTEATRAPGLSKRVVNGILSRASTFAMLETGPTCKRSRLRGNVVGGNGEDSPGILGLPLV